MASGDHIEIESKYDVGEDTALPDLAALVGVAGVASVGEPQVAEMEATYYDTEGLALARNRSTLRRRVGGSDEGWHLKLRAQDGRREVHQPLSRGVRTPPKVLRSTVRAFARDEPLVPVAALRTRRTSHHLLDAQGTVLLEVADDRVEAESFGVGQVWREWEAELAGGDRELLDAADGLLRGAGAAPAGWASKLSRALGDRRPADDAPEPATPESPASAVVGARIAEQVDRIRGWDPLVRRDTPDAVHKMRVAVRRLRSALATYRPLLDRAVTEPVRDELRWLGGVLGEARDAEVMRARLDRQLETEAPGVSGTARRLTDRRLAARRREAQAEVVKVLDGPRYLALLDALESMATSPPWSGKADQPAGVVLRKRVAHDRRRMEQAHAPLADTTSGAPRELLLHEVRKAAKRVRYATEPLTPLYGKDATRYAQAHEAIQTTLGDHHDAVEARELVRRLADDAAGDGSNTFGLGVLYARQEADAVAAEAAFDAAYERASRKRLRGWLAT